MATWHQQRRPVNPRHDTLWTVVEGTINGQHEAHTLCRTEDEARAYEARVRELRPQIGTMIWAPRNAK